MRERKRQGARSRSALAFPKKLYYYIYDILYDILCMIFHARICAEASQIQTVVPNMISVCIPCKKSLRNGD